ncbi:MAG: MraY family glycosyltransferase [Bacteroidota bacterium]
MFSENSHMNFFYVCFFIAAFIFSFLLNTLFLRFSHTLGIRDKKGTVIRWASTSKPALGGISFYIIFLLSFTFYSMFFQPQEILLNKKMLGLISTATIAFLMGLADDAYNTRPFLKLFVQIFCGIILCYYDIYINIFPSMPLNYGLTIFWVVAVMNSINMLDNMDAISSIVAICNFSTALMLIYFSNELNNIHFIILIGMIASLLGFLRFNWYPSKLYMGDTGSQVLGLLLASFSIIYFWNDSTSKSETISVTRQLVIVGLTFLLPISDTLAVIINRLLKKRSPFIGGRDHTTHHLFFRGVTERRIALLFAFLGLFSLFLVYIIKKHIPVWNYTHFFIFVTYGVIIFLFLFIITHLKKNIVNGHKK